MTAIAGTPLAAFLSYALLVLMPWQTAARNIHSTPPKTSLTYDELAGYLFFNQMAIIELMRKSSNASCAIGNMGNESNADREATERLEEMLGTRMDRVSAALEVQHRRMQEMLEGLNSTVMDTLTKVDEMREEMTEEDMQMSATLTTEQTGEEEAAAVPEVAYSGVIVHNDSLPSRCNGNKILFGTIGSLTVVESGTYPKSTVCSWNLTFPVESSVNLNWKLIDLENHSSCFYDWVDVKHNHQSVYGRTLCGTLDSSTLQLLDLTLHKVRNLIVSFRSDGSNEKSGFRLLYHTY